MKKSNFKKAFALSALMAFVITGSAYANDLDTKDFKNTGTLEGFYSTITVTDGTFDNTGTLGAEKVTINNGIFFNTGTIKVDILDIYGNANDKAAIAGTITANKEFIYSGIGGNSFGRPLTAIVNTPKLHIIGEVNQTGLQIFNSETLANVKEIFIESNAPKTGLVIGSQNNDNTPNQIANVKIDAPIYLQTNAGNQDARVEVSGGSSLIAENIIALNGKTKVQLNGDETSATLNNITVQSGGDFSLQTLGKTNPNDPKNPLDPTNTTVTFNLNNITVGDNAEFKTSIYQNKDGSISCSAANIKSDNLTINLGKNAKADFGGVGTYLGEGNAKNKTDWRGDLINFDVNKLTINVNGTDEYDYKTLKEYKDDYNYGVYIHVNDKYNPLVQNGCDEITVVGASSNNTGNLANDLQRLAYVVKMTREYENEEGTKLPEILAPTGAHVEQNPGGIDDGGKGTVNDDGTVDIDEIIKNPDVFGTEEIGALGLISWRNELDDMNKRLGELRDSKGEHGVWVRMVRGENDYKSLNSQYNTYQLGYDEKLSTDPHWTLGAAFSYTDGDGGYDTGSFEMDHKTFTLYGSKLNDDGSYIDIVGKYSRLNHDLRNTWGDGEYDANGYSIGVEVGKRFQQGNGFWIEPQAQLTYGHVGSANYTAGDIKVAQDGMESLIGRAGVRFGKDLDNGNIYLRASYLYDFDGETGVTLTNAEGRERSFDQDLGGGWCEVGIGTNINLSDATHLYFDIEKTYGGDITTDWKWNAGIRYSF